MQSDPTKNTLFNDTLPYGKITFIHGDGTTHTFQSGVNKLTGNRLSWFDNFAPSVGDSLKTAVSTFRKIKVSSQKVLEETGTILALVNDMQNPQKQEKTQVNMPKTTKITVKPAIMVK